DSKNLKNHTIGISIGDRNGNIKDIIKTFEIFKNKNYVKYFELNISCPNIPLEGAKLSEPKNFEKLVKEIKTLKTEQPIFIKMPNEISFSDSDKLVNIALRNKIKGFIFSNLIKDRTNPFFNRDEINKFKNFKGNFSGKPTFK